jgi:hypothetical protein
MLTRPQPRIDAVRMESASDCAWITDYSEGIQVAEKRQYSIGAAPQEELGVVGEA